MQSYGGKVGWEGAESPISAKTSSITHHIVDRPKLPKDYENLPKSREFVQPQWILDCSNFMVLMPIAKYAVGAALPPHLSPWVDNEEEGYKPAYAEEIERIKAGESVDTIAADNEADNESSSSEDEDMEGQEEEEVNDNADDDESADELEVTDKDKQMVKKKRKKKRKKEDVEADEAKELARSMMSRKAAHLYGRMQHGITQKKQKAEELQRRRKDIEGKKKDETGKTVLKQKVERLKDERRAIEDTYAETGGSMKKKKRTNK